MTHSLFDRIAGLFRDIGEYGGLARRRVRRRKNSSSVSVLAKS